MPEIVYRRTYKKKTKVHRVSYDTLGRYPHPDAMEWVFFRQPNDRRVPEDVLRVLVYVQGSRESFGKLTGFDIPEWVTYNFDRWSGSVRMEGGKVFKFSARDHGGYVESWVDRELWAEHHRKWEESHLIELKLKGEAELKKRRDAKSTSPKQKSSPLCKRLRWDTVFRALKTGIPAGYDPKKHPTLSQLENVLLLESCVMPEGSTLPDGNQSDTLNIYDDGCRLVLNDRQYVLSQRNAITAFSVIAEQHPHPIKRERWFHAVYKKLNRPPPNYVTWKPSAWFRKDSGDGQIAYKELIDRRSKEYRLSPSVRWVKRHPSSH